jgi:hypothetical protein
MSGAAAEDRVGRFWVQVNKGLATVAGDFHSETLGRDGLASRIRFYRRLAGREKTGHFYQVTLRAYERAMVMLDASLADVEGYDG